MSDSSFDDDDDDMLLLQLVGAVPPPPPHQPAPLPPRAAADAPADDPQAQLFRAQGEIAILRAQLETLQAQRAHESAKLSADAQSAQAAAQEHVALLKQTVDKLEDEKRFLGNEVRSLAAVKRRKVPAVAVPVAEGAEGAEGGAETLGTPDMGPAAPALQTHALAMAPRIQLQDDWAQLCHHLWRCTICGADRTSMAFLSRICFEHALAPAGALEVPANTPFLACLWEALLVLRHLRLDALVRRVCELVLALVDTLLQRHEQGAQGALVAVPFLLSIVHAAASFKPAAVTEKLAKLLVAACSLILQRFVCVLRQNDEDDETFAGQGAVPYQHRLFENLILLLAFDVLEAAVVISTQFGNGFCRSLWDDGVVARGLMQQILPENTERFVSSAQINLVSSFVEIMSASVGEGHFATSDDELNRLLVKSLLKVFIIDIGIKEDFMFYGLNRVLGNNHDLAKISQAVPAQPEKFFNKSLVSIPYPVEAEKLDSREKFRIAAQHDCHLLTLRVRIVMLLEAIVVSERMDLLNLKENLKSIVRIIGYEQNQIIHQPRAKLIHMRLTIIGVFVRILFYIIEEQRNINTLIYPETLYEIFVVLLRIAFASDSLAFEAQELLSQIRARGFTELGVFNDVCESRSREMAHFDLFHSSPEKHLMLAGIEGDFANGLEFPYELDTIEIAREILSVCVNHDEADNLYYNMNKETQ